QMEKLGGLGGLMGMLPGVAKVKDQMASAGVNDRMIARQVAIINSMTPEERRNPDLLKNSRKKRIAAGSGTSAEEINKLIKMHRGMADMMKQVGKGGRGPMAGLANMFGLGGGFPGGGVPDLSKLPPPDAGGVSPDALAEAQKKLEQMQGSGGKLPGLPGLGKPGLPGLGGGGGLPGLGGFNPFGRKK
ncbi:MAG: signal recognition particle protein, partial [Rhabdaerophilum sp.]